MAGCGCEAHRPWPGSGGAVLSLSPWSAFCEHRSNRTHPPSSSRGLPACCGAGIAFMEHSSTQVGCRPGLEHLSGPCNEPGPVAAVPGGRAWPHHPLWLALGLLVLRLCSAENFLKKPSGRQVLEKPSVARLPIADSVLQTSLAVSLCFRVWS